MKYDDPRLRDILAGAYVMATLPRRAAARFERLMAEDPSLGALVEEWRERLAPLDATAPPVEPPARVWRAVEAEIAAPGPLPIRQPVAQPSRWWDWLPLWRGLALGAMAATAALLLYITVPSPLPPPGPEVVAVLTDQSGAPSWIATAEPREARVSIAALQPQAIAPDRSFELWAIAGGPPRSLGLLRPGKGDRLTVAASEVPHDGVLAVSLEPQGGSPTKAPTGPVLYQGKILR
jgi:anti-sigma-K factor RskA